VPDVSFEKGWVIRKARHLYAPGELINAMNCVPDVTGALVTRPGMSVINTVAAPTLHSWYQTFSGGSPTYQGATQANGQGIIYRNYTTTLVSGGTGGLADFVDFPEYLTNITWTFMCMQGQTLYRRKDDGTTTYNWSIAAPSAAAAAAVGAAGNPNGTYVFQYIYVRERGGVPVSWGNPSPKSTPITVVNQQINLSGIGDPTNVVGPDYDPQVTHVYIYANQAANQLLLFMAGRITAGTTTFNYNLADASLPIASGMPSGLLEVDNGVPPPFTAMAIHQNRIWGVTGTDNRVYWSKAHRGEQFAATAYLEVGALTNVTKGLREWNGDLYVFSQGKVTQILGTDDSTYTPKDTMAADGSPASFSIATGWRGMYYLGNDGVYRGNGVQFENITDEKLYPLFHNQVVPGFSALNFAPPTNAVGAWHQGRYYLSFPTVAATVQTIVYDELSDTWWPDSRSFLRYFYAKNVEQFIGTNGNTAYLLNNAVQDVNVSIPITIQTRDEVSNDPAADLSLYEVVFDIDSSGTGLTVTAKVDFDISSVSLGTVGSSGRSQQTAVVPSLDSVMGKAIGYLITGTGVIRLYRILPKTLNYPTTRLALDTLPTDLGYPGPKRIVGYWLDSQLLSAGSIVSALYGDGTLQQSLTQSTIGRQQQDLLSQTFDATILRVVIQSTAKWRLFPDSFIAWVPLPPEYFIYDWPKSDLGVAAHKIFQHLWLDVELMSQGTLTAIITIDGVSFTFPVTGVGRILTKRMRCPSAASGRLVEIALTSTVRWRLWKGDLAYVVLGSGEGLQRYALTTMAGAKGPQVQRSPIAA
jgi:hypothetical protein